MRHNAVDVAFSCGLEGKKSRTGLLSASFALPRQRT